MYLIILNKLNCQIHHFFNGNRFDLSGSYKISLSFEEKIWKEIYKVYYIDLNLKQINQIFYQSEDSKYK